MDQPAATRRDIAPGAAVTAPPAWVDLAPYDIPAEPNPHFIANGVCVLLDDSQIDLCEPDRAWFYRRAELVTAAAGAERAAQFSVNYDPAFERLEVHRISVIRGGERIEHAHTAFFEVLRRERNMERLQFDGRLTVHVTLPDVRQGDVVETSYTLYGARKSLGGRHSLWIPFEWGVGIIETRLRQRAPKSRRIAELAVLNPPGATETEADGLVDRRWRTFEHPGVRFETLTPPWVLQTAHMQFSEWRDWAEVASVFSPLYEDADPLPAEIEAEIARISQSYASRSERAAAVLRFAQSAVRYLAISMGEGGYTPRPLADICATRYGDCKDKTKLYVHMARRLGLDACPALVNTQSGYVLNEWLPAGTLFDHCIVRLAVDGKTYWLDPTRQLQPSPLDAVSQCHFGWALPLRPQTTALERMPDPTPVHSQETFERITLGKSPQHAVRYEWRITSRRGRAEWVREIIAREGQVGMFKLYAEDIGRRYAGAKPLRQEVVDDDERENTITVLEVYEIADAWTTAGPKARQFGTHDLTMKPQLAPLDAGAHKYPIYLGQIGKVSRRVELEIPYNVRFKGWSRSVDASTVSFKSELKKEGQRLFVLEQTLEFRALTLPPEEAGKYRQIIAELDQSDLLFSAGVGKRGAFVGGPEHQEEVRHRGWLFNVAWIVLVLAYWMWLYLRDAPGPFG